MSFSVIKENDLFYVSNPHGNVPDPKTDAFGYGLYTQDTRVLCRWTCDFGPIPFVKLDSDVSRNFEGVYHYTNREYRLSENVTIPRESLYITRTQFVDGHCFYEQVEIENFSTQPLPLRVTYGFDADFLDMFEVRAGVTLDPRDKLARRIEVETGTSSRTFRYTAQDGIQYSTVVRFIADEREWIPAGDGSRFEAQLTIPARGKCQWVVTVQPSVERHTKKDSSGQGHTSLQNASTSDFTFAEVAAVRQQIARKYEDWLHKAPGVSGCTTFSNWYRRGLQDIRMLLTDVGYGHFPVAGVPWYAVPFGRDSLITALQMLPANFDIVRGTLATMAAFQGQQVNPERDEQPGKIMHELRAGELTRTGQVPFGPYYGTIDATPLFLNLAADYALWSGDAEWLRRLLPHVEAAFAWIEQYGDRDGDGFLEYFSESSNGIANQGWKDSGDSIHHKDGSLAKGPIALCEVQGYVYRAYTRWAQVYRWLGLPDTSMECERRAERLQRQFIQAFWMEDEDAIALALDGEKKPVRTLTSNMGQVLWSGILPQALADCLIDRLLKEDLFSGFGIRTLSTLEVTYNPLSYHNGSVWPHDNSIIIAGVAGYGRRDAVAQLVEGLLNAAQGFDLYRLPELFAGIPAGKTSKPVPYPVSCSPQAWAAATPILVLTAILGFNPNVPDGYISLNPSLPSSIPRLKIESLRIGSGTLSLELQRTADGNTQYQILDNSTGLSVHPDANEEVLDQEFTVGNSSFQGS
ncbi:glycogen debranching N-terminal domain-containing protein [Alicyclobacillus herbarius]|uniref:amylo-alpha-1,6-glucosidase n=1 Tax=Alicyclobacillus herbarius TaxID=122960 RepID=UPI0004103A69|nr:glycogen debranching N-terminal domain-containing protein [Alicyclobacillus herbarius]